METSTIWWLLAGAAVVLELLTGTFYLLMLALGLAAGAIAAHLGFGQPMQLVMSALVGGGAVLLWHLKQAKSRLASHAGTEANQDVHIDIGSRVDVAAWSASGTTRVLHRGAQWAARHSESGLQAQPNFVAGMHAITAIEGNTLVLAKI